MASHTTRTEKLDLRLTRNAKRALQAMAARPRSVIELVSGERCLPTKRPCCTFDVSPIRSK